MARIYSQPASGQKTPHLEPKQETVAFLLNYSKALSVSRLSNMEFEMLLN